MGLEIEEKFQGGSGTSGKFLATEINKIVAVINGGIGSKTGNDSLKTTLEHISGGLFIKHLSGSVYRAYDIDKYIFNNSLTHASKRVGIILIDILVDGVTNVLKTISFSNNFDVTSNDTAGYMLQEGFNKVSVNFDTGKFTLINVKIVLTQGHNGATGARGLTGLTGARGATGLTGARGSTGARGAKGDKGDAAPDLSNLHPTHRFKATFTNTDKANITYTGTSAILADNNGTEVAYISGANIPAGTYTLYGLGITKLRFNKNVFIDIHIERNEDQTNAANMFVGLSNLAKFTAKPVTFGNVTNMISTWALCNSLTPFPYIDTSSVTSLANTWHNCTSLTSFPAINISSARLMHATWGSCSGLTSFPYIDTSSVTDLRYTWFRCTSLTSFPRINISSVTDLRYTWYGCTSLICTGGFINNGIAPTNTANTFLNTPALLAPNATEQASILNGNAWLNSNSC